MRRQFLIVQMIVWFQLGFAQEFKVWERYTLDQHQIALPFAYGTWMIELPKSEVLKDHNLRLLCSFDSNHHVVIGNVSGLNKVWSVNHLWKLDLEGNKENRYYVVGISSLDKAFYQVEVLRKYPDSKTYLIRANNKFISEELAKNPNVIHISDRIHKPYAESRVIDLNLNPNRINKLHHFYPLLDGSSEIISIQENRYDTDDIDLLNRSVSSGLESEITDNHATEMATIIAGRGNSFVTGRGVAKEVTLSSSDFFDAMPDPADSYATLGIITQNHSYGIARENRYGVEARAFDQSVRNNNNLLHVFSSGNEGLEVSTEGTYQGIEGYANLTGNIKMSKNAMIVGSVDTLNIVPVFVSRGPAYDGRIKPDMVAYSVVGSSNSAALVSGVATLLQQQYRTLFDSNMPAALVKALLINGAEDIGEPGPDFLAGYGNLNAWNSLAMLNEDQYQSGTVEQGETEEINIVLPEEAVNLKVTLVWTDPEANVNDFEALVNDLDLRLDDGSAEVLPWVLDPSPNLTALSSNATRGIDRLNNVEQVSIDSPGSTNYTIEIEGSTVTGSQAFAVAWQYEIEDTFEWDFPTGSDNMPYNGETGSYFRWSTTKTGAGELSYTEDESQWVVLDESVNLSTEYWRWNNPPEIENEVKARMRMGEEIVETDFFTVSRPLNAQVGFNCADSLMLRWDPTPHAISYDVNYLQEDRLTLFEQTTDTFLIIQNVGQVGTRQFSIKPNLESGKQLLPAPTFDYSLQGVECYVFSFFQTVALDTGIYLNLNLGTTYGIESISFERNEQNGFQEIASYHQFNSDAIRFLDDSPNQGYNEHRATISFENGEELSLSAGASFYLTEIPVRLFPNPVQAGEDVNIITKEFENRGVILELINSQGALIYRQEIQGTQDTVPTANLRSGMYYYRIIADNNTFIGRILVR